MGYIKHHSSAPLQVVQCGQGGQRVHEHDDKVHTHRGYNPSNDDILPRNTWYLTDCGTGVRSSFLHLPFMAS